MDPVSTKQGTATPPITTSICGQALIKLPSLLPFCTPDEPEVAPLERRLRGSTGASFPVDEMVPDEGLVVKEKVLVVGGGSVLYSRWQSDQDADTADR